MIKKLLSGVSDVIIEVRMYGINWMSGSSKGTEQGGGAMCTGGAKSNKLHRTIPLLIFSQNC